MSPAFVYTQSDTPVVVGLIVLGLLFLGPALRSWIYVIEWAKGKRADMSQYVTRAEFQQAREERDKQLQNTVQDMKKEMDSIAGLVRTLTNDLPAIHRALGRLEGHDEAERRAR
jgi:chorismate synthase